MKTITKNMKFSLYLENLKKASLIYYLKVAIIDFLAEIIISDKKK